MKAIILKAAGGTEQLVMEEVPLPEPQPGEVLVRVNAISVNPVDIKTRKGLALYNSLKEQQPVVLGWDVSGVITAVGDDVTGFEVGDAVFGMVRFPGHGKAYAEYVAAPAAHLAHKPSGLSHSAAAASTLALLTAWQVLVNQANVQGGETVLMQAAAGGVGHFGVQVAKHLGAVVIGTGSAANEEFVRGLGASAYVDYHAAPFETVIKDVDVVFDAVGGDLPRRALGVLKSGGRLVAIAGGVTDEVKAEAAARGVSASTYLVQSSGPDMLHLAGLLESGVIRPEIAREFSFDDMAAAHQQVETGRTRGKVVVLL